MNTKTEHKVIAALKKRTPLTPKQTLIACLILLLFTGITFFLFTYRRDERQFEQITTSLFQEEMTASTLSMHYTLAHPADFGIYHYDALLPCYSANAELQSQAATENILASLNALNCKKLSDKSYYSYRLLTRSLENSLAQNNFLYYEEPLSPSSGMQSQLPILLAEYTFRTRQDVEDYLCLLDQTDEYFASLLTYEQEKAAAGLLMSTSSLEKVKEQCDTILTKEALDNGTHFLQTTFQERLASLMDSQIITSEEYDKYVALNDRLLKTVMLPAYSALADGLFLLEDDSIPLRGLADKPQGAEYYLCLLRSQTGSYRDIQEIRQLLSEAFHTEFEASRQIVAEHPDIYGYLATYDNSEFPYTEAAGMLLDLQTRMRHQFPALPETAGVSDSNEISNSVSGLSSDTAPDSAALTKSNSTSVRVKAVSPSLENYCAPAFYLTAPLDDTDSNVIYINQKQTPTGVELYTTLAHEGYPGHLYQTVYCNRLFQQEDENLIRQALWYGGYLEGWALYVEFLSFDYAGMLMEEQGHTQDALCIQLEKHNRSLLLCLYSLLDIMIHYENASYEQVSQVLESFGITEPASTSAIYTYIAEEPCNYLKYYLGYLEILELQKQAKQLWQDSYSDLAFHTFYLNCGPSDFATLQEELLNTPLPQSYGKTD